VCKFVGIVVYQGLVEDVRVFNEKSSAIKWIAIKANEYGVEDSLDSLVWDVEKQSRIYLGFALAHQEITT